MANNMVKFYKVASLPSTLVPGAIYFVTTTQSIHVATSASAADKFGIGLKDAELADSKLTITRYDGTTVVVDFSDIASASSVVAALALKADKTQVDDAIIAEAERASEVEAALNERVTTIEGLLAEDGNDTIDNLKEVIDYFAGVKETETGAALISDVATIKSSYVKSVKTTAGSKGYVTLTPNDATTGDVTIAVDDSAIANKFTELEGQINDAVAGSVTSFGGKTGAITVKGGQNANGSVNLSMSNNELQASIVGLGSAAYTDAGTYATAGQGTKADTAIQSITNADGFITPAPEGTTVDLEVEAHLSTNTADATDAALATSALAKKYADGAEANANAYTDSALAWVEFN